MVNDSMAMNAKPACASICLAANHTIVIGAVTATVLELFLLIAIGCISIYLSVIFLSEIISSVRVRPGSAPDIITLYAHYRI